MYTQIVIVGAGPAGLSLARALSSSGARIILVDTQQLTALSDPSFDGREIALTHQSISDLEQLGVWDRIDAKEVFTLREAQIYDGKSPYALRYGPGEIDGQLGCMVSNCTIRKAAYEAVKDLENVEVLAGAKVVSLEVGKRSVRITLSDGKDISAALLIGADSRFSFVRDQLGIGAEMNRLGKAMLVGRVKIGSWHDDIATEWFDHGQTLALLPLGDGVASAVLTLPESEAATLQKLKAEALGQELQRRYRGRFGTMTPLSPLHSYPLTTTYSKRFVAHRAALIGDAAVGMHPVTAHGFNLGLASVRHLSEEILPILERGGDPANPAALARYERRHRRESRPIYLATNSIVGLYTDDRPPARIARRVSLRLAQLLPARKAVQRMLMKPARERTRLRRSVISSKLRLGR
ncbi:hypothetical protein EH31_11090 [Erythrobacter longus]|uniref:FAD-binding domain-containing protein n=1 Tax=Erythrobacter longus TaxID=1044 RepID=A0A074MAD0_ERYLO|nr:5-demethoxyubiquinol-8 5-hydroxylase UbiM [Erythrobacter longus]KEO89695.1 hypothetical protein EH31_11090 [Erythrobacter longus]